MPEQAFPRSLRLSTARGSCSMKRDGKPALAWLEFVPASRPLDKARGPAQSKVQGDGVPLQPPESLESPTADDPYRALIKRGGRSILAERSLPHEPERDHGERLAPFRVVAGTGAVGVAHFDSRRRLGGADRAPRPRGSRQPP